MRWGAGELLFLAAIASGCGGSTKRGLDEPSDTSMTSTGTASTGVGGTGMLDAGPDADLDAGFDAPQDVVSDFVDPGCPDAEPPPPELECDPLATPTGCDSGLACYPFIERPGGEGCDFEQFGATCLPPGSVQVGERCGGDFGWCDAGLLCVVGALSGARCLKLCDPYGPNTCSAGLICAPVDVEGYGVCG